MYTQARVHTYAHIHDDSKINLINGTIAVFRNPLHFRIKSGVTTLACP